MQAVRDDTSSEEAVEEGNLEKVTRTCANMIPIDRANKSWHAGNHCTDPGNDRAPVNAPVVPVDRSRASFVKIRDMEYLFLDDKVVRAEEADEGSKKNGIGVQNIQEPNFRINKRSLKIQMTLRGTICKLFPRVGCNTQRRQNVSATT